MQRFKVLALLLAVALMLPACAAFQPVGDYFADVGDKVKHGAEEFVGSFDVDVEGSKSGASVTVEGIGVSASVGVDWKAIGCVLTYGLIDALCEDPEPELQPRE